MSDRSALFRTWVGITAAIALWPAACRSPFATYPDEYGMTVEGDRVRAVRSLDLAAKATPDPGPPERPTKTFFEGADKREVTIEQCRAWTLQQNLDLQVALIDPGIAATFVSEEEARFEAAFIARIAGSDTDDRASDVFLDETLYPFEFSPGVRIPLRTGGTAIVRLPINRADPFPGFEDETWSTDFEVSFIQPLLRNAGRWTNTHPIRIAALESQAAEARTKLEVIRQIAAADRAYWLLYEALKILEVRQEQYEQAVAQMDRAESRFRGRVGPEIEVVRAQAGVSRRLASIIVADLRARDRQRTLKRIINLPGLDVDSAALLAPTSSPDPVRYSLDAQELIAQSLAERMELLELELRLAQDASTIDFEKNQRLPLFTLDYSYRVNGAGETFGESVEDGVGWSSDGWRAGLTVEVPIGNEAAESRVHRAILGRLQRLSTQSAREQSIKQEVLDALDNLEAAWQRIQAARQSVVAEARNYRAEQGQFLLGLRNSTEVLDAEGRLSDAKAEEVRAVVDYQIAQIDLAFATGTLLGAARVSW